MASIFTRIINRELPGRFVYRTTTLSRFLTIEPMTQATPWWCRAPRSIQWQDVDGADFAGSWR